LVLVGVGAITSAEVGGTAGAVVGATPGAAVGAATGAQALAITNSARIAHRAKNNRFIFFSSFEKPWDRRMGFSFCRDSIRFTSVEPKSLAQNTLKPVERKVFYRAVS
jgi:hypothetical protein